MCDPIAIFSQFLKTFLVVNPRIGFAVVGTKMYIKEYLLVLIGPCQSVGLCCCMTSHQEEVVEVLASVRLKPHRVVFPLRKYNEEFFWRQH
jgi:hypothetical protein